MKFSQMKYTRPDVDKIRAEFDSIIAKLESAETADGQISAIFEHEKLKIDYETQATLVSIRNSLNTKDEF